MSVFPGWDVITSLWAASLKNESARAVMGRVSWHHDETPSKYLGLLQLHLSVSFLNGIRVLTLSLQERERQMSFSFINSLHWSDRFIDSSTVLKMLTILFELKARVGITCQCIGKTWKTSYNELQINNMKTITQNVTRSDINIFEKQLEFFNL